MVRTTVIPSNETVHFNVPKEYIGKEVEVIAFTKTEGELQHSNGKKTVSFDAIAIDTKAQQFNRDEANER
jgi:hypothetical protein